MVEREEETVLTDRWTAHRRAASVLGPRTDSQGKKWIKDNIQYRTQYKYLNIYDSWNLPANGFRGTLFPNTCMDPAESRLIR
jgi:hypothetical protein